MNSAKRDVVLAVLLSAVTGFAPRAGLAATYNYYVGRGSGTAPFETWGKATNNIQAAITRAEADWASGSTYNVIVTDGVYTVSSEIAITKAITVQGFHGRNVTIVNGNGSVRCFNITATSALLDGFTITNGYALGASGGGIGMTGASTVQNCTITGNRASANDVAGGVYVGLGTVQDCTIRDNTAGQNGGAYLAVAASTLRNCTVTGNRTSGGWNRYAGIGMYNGLVENCVISNNTTAGDGGGVVITFGTVRNCLIAGNSAGGYGGGVASGWRGTIQNCTIVGNTAATGGGVVQSEANWIRNCIVYFNSATTGPNLYRTAGVFTNSCTTPAIFNNLSGDPQLASVAGRDYRLLPGSPCIDSASTVGVVAYDLEGNLRPKDGNGDSVAGYDIGAYEAAEMTSGGFRCNFIATPLIGYGTLKAAFHAYVAGSNATGLAYRWVLGDGTIIGWPGAADVTNTYGQGTYTVALTVSNAFGQTVALAKTSYLTVYLGPTNYYYVGPGRGTPPYSSWANATTNIEAAVNRALADVVPGVADCFVIVSNGTYRVTTSPDGISITKSITLRGLSGNPANSIIRGGYPGVSNRCLTVTCNDAVIAGLTFANGYLSAASGAGISMTAASTVSNCVIASNYVGNTSGGGLYMTAGTVRNSTIRDNTAGQGGGAWQNGAGATLRNCTITRNKSDHWWYRYGGLILSAGVVENCVISSNRAVGGECGGALLGGGAMRSCLVVGNTASTFGGGLVSNWRCVLENGTVVGNTAGTYGGGVVQSEANWIRNCIVYFNSATTGPNTYWTAGVFTNSCTTPALFNNISGPPQFVANSSGYGVPHVAGDYHLISPSPCANTGVYQSWMATAVDIEGYPRVLDGAVNMGAYERLVRPLEGTLLLIR